MNDNGLYQINNGYAYIYYPNINKTENIEKLNLQTNDILYYSENYVIVDFKDSTQYVIPDEFDETLFKIYYFDYELFKDKISLLKEKQLNYKIENNKLIGNIESNGELLLITIPYEEGLKIKINNEYKEVLNCMDTLTCVYLDDGLNNIELSFEQPGFKVSILISFLSIISTFIFLKQKKY